jgi:hypothetical protein
MYGAQMVLKMSHFFFYFILFFFFFDNHINENLLQCLDIIALDIIVKLIIMLLYYCGHQNLFSKITRSNISCTHILCQKKISFDYCLILHWAHIIFKLTAIYLDDNTIIDHQKKKINIFAFFPFYLKISFICI